MNSLGYSSARMSRTEWGRGNVYRRGRQFWIRYPDGTGRQRRESAGRDEQKARRLLERRLVELEDDRLPATSKERKTTVNQLLDALVADWAARKCRGLATLISVLKAVREAFGERRASTITTKQLADFILERRTEGDSDTTINQQLRRLRRAFKLQAAIPEPKFPPLPRENVRDVLIAPAEQRRLLAAFTEDAYRDATEFKFTTGWRGNEVLTLEWRHMRQDSIRLVEEYSKTGEPRDFPLAGVVAGIVERWRAKRVPICPFVFHRGGRPLSYTRWKIAWQRAAVAAGLGQLIDGKYRGVNLHDTRRAFVTDSINAGVDPQTARTLSGHKSNTIFERYRIVTNEVLARAVEKRERYVESRADGTKVMPMRRRISR